MTHSAPSRSPNDDHLDRHFAAYFRSRMPEPWPDCPVPDGTDPARPARRDGLMTGRLTLAASVAALLGLGLAIAPDTQPRAGGPVAGPNEPKLLDKARADGKGLLNATTPTAKNK